VSATEPLQGQPGYFVGFLCIYQPLFTTFGWSRVLTAFETRLDLGGNADKPRHDSKTPPKETAGQLMAMTRPPVEGHRGSNSKVWRQGRCNSS
jgi:hypothetical protein